MALLAFILLAAGTSSPSSPNGDILGVMRSGDGSEWKLIDAPTRLGGECAGQKRLVILSRDGEYVEGYCWRLLPNTQLISLSAPDQSVMTVPASFIEAQVTKP